MLEQESLTEPEKLSYYRARVVLRTEFTISRKAFGIKKDAPSMVVGDEIDIRLGIVGTHLK